MPRYLLRPFTAAVLLLMAAAGATEPATQQPGTLLLPTHDACAPAVGKLLLTGLALLCCALALLALHGICSMRCGTRERHDEKAGTPASRSAPGSPVDQPPSASSTT